MENRMRRAFPLGVIVCGLVLLSACRQQEQPDKPEVAQATTQAASADDDHDPLGPNAACYMCHMPFVDEKLATTHLNAKIYCTECHGPSTAHVNDENIGATPPDIIIKRDQIDASCAACHKTHDVPPQKVIARFLERTKAKPTSQPATQSTQPSPVCTDCHGTHKISDL